MSNTMPTHAEVRQVLLEVLRGNGDEGFGREEAIKQTAARLGPYGDRNSGRTIMDGFDDLYRSGIISNGLNLANLGSNWAHLTAHGRESLKNLDRDPANQKGYLGVIDPFIRDQPIAVSYLVEALDTYNKGSFKSAAVMLGCAAEALTLSLRDRLKAKITSNGGSPLAGLDDWRIAVVLLTVEKAIEPRVVSMVRELRERFESYWSAFTGLYRITRNDVGHPKSVEPVTRDAIHGGLLLFHEHARLMFDIGAWIDSTF